VGSTISDQLRRFLLTGTLSVPHVEAILQLRRGAAQEWDAERLGARIYVSVTRAADILADLLAIGIVDVRPENTTYRYSPRTSELRMLLDELETIYSEQLVVVTKLIHTAEERKPQEFAAAFRFRKET